MGGLEAAIAPFSELERTLRVDAEYFKKPYIETERELDALATDTVATLTHVSDGNHFTISDDFVEEGIPYYRGQDVVGHFFIEAATPNFITEEAFNRKYMARSHLKKGDVLLSIVGTIGELSLVDTDAPATCSCKLAILRPHKISPEVLAIFLRSRHGRNQIERLTRGAIQGSLLLEDMDQLRIPAWGKNLSSRLASVIQKSKVENAEVSKHAMVAENRLLTSLGLANWTPPEPLAYAAPFSAAFTSARLDAQYYMPAKQQVQEALRRLPGVSLGDRFSSIRDMMDPKKDSAPLIVRNYDVTDALQPILDDEKEITSIEDIGSTKKVLQSGDVAISRLRAYLREIAVVRTDGKIPAVGSSEFIVLRPKTKADRAIAPETLLTFLRSAPVQTILKWCQDGSQHPRFSEADLLAIHLPDAVQAASAEIEGIVKQGFAARHRARALLDAAKRAVEIAIEDSEAAAVAYLDTVGA